MSRPVIWQLLACLAGLLTIIFAGRVLLTVLAGVLLATALRGLAGYVGRYGRVPARWSFAATICLLVAMIAGTASLLAGRVVNQIHQLADTIPKSLAHIETVLNHSRLGREVVQVTSAAFSSEKAGTHATTYAAGAGEAVTDAFVIVAIGLFIGISPEPYRRGVFLLVPEKHRRRFETLLDEAGRAVQSWLLGQLVPMVALGVATLIGLSILNIPLAFTLSLITALLLFIPYVGAILAFVPSVLVALSQGLTAALSVSAVYIGVHMLEGYVITPLIQRRAVRLPPALTLSSQLLMWKLAGVMGVLIATPMAAAALVIVQRLRSLPDSPDEPHRQDVLVTSHEGPEGMPQGRSRSPLACDAR